MSFRTRIEGSAKNHPNMQQIPVTLHQLILKKPWLVWNCGVIHGEIEFLEVFLNAWMIGPFALKSASNKFLTNE